MLALPLRRPAALAPLIALLAAPAAAESLSVAARRALDVTGGRLLEDVVVRIQEGRIAAVERRAPGEAVTHDLGDVTLLPGLIDCHTHLIGGEELTPYQELRETAARAAIEGVANARKTLLAGFTTVRDLGSRDFADLALRDAIAAGRVAGPRLLVAVRSLSITGGHGDRNDLPFDVLVHRYSAIADGREEIWKTVRENVKYGADWRPPPRAGATSPPTPTARRGSSAPRAPACARSSTPRCWTTRRSLCSSGAGSSSCRTRSRTSPCSSAARPAASRSTSSGRAPKCWS
jgi:hypothetical protein